MTGRSRKPPVHIHANLTPLIDVTFLLIVFFVLVSQITNSRIADEIVLPKPEHAVSQADESTDEIRLTLNVIPEVSNRTKVATYRFGTRDYPPTPSGLTALTGELKKALREHPAMILDFRADQLTTYGLIFPAINAARGAGVHRLNLRVRPSDDH